MKFKIGDKIIYNGYGTYGKDFESLHPTKIQEIISIEGANYKTDNDFVFSDLSSYAQSCYLLTDFLLNKGFEGPVFLKNINEIIFSYKHKENITFYYNTNVCSYGLATTSIEKKCNTITEIERFVASIKFLFTDNFN